MKKLLPLISLLLVASMIALTGCGQEQEAAPAASAKPETVPEQTEEADPADDVKALYESFMKNECKAEIKKDLNCFKSGEEYDMDGLCKAFEEDIEGSLAPSNGYNLSYAYIDCGLDGIPELVLEQDMLLDDNSGDYYQYYIFNCKDGKIGLVSTQYTYYRVCADISENGYIVSSGSSSAFESSTDYSYINADGEEIFLAAVDYYTGSQGSYIPYYSIPDDVRPEDYPMDRFAEGDDYTSCITANWEHFNYESDDPEYYLTEEYETAYNAYLAGNFYTFEDANGENAEVDAADAAVYDSMGLKYYDQETFWKMIDDHMTELGCNTEVMNGSMISYTPVE